MYYFIQYMICFFVPRHQWNVWAPLVGMNDNLYSISQPLTTLGLLHKCVQYSVQLLYANLFLYDNLYSICKFCKFRIFNVLLHTVYEVFLCTASSMKCVGLLVGMNDNLYSISQPLTTLGLLYKCVCNILCILVCQPILVLQPIFDFPTLDHIWTLT